MKYCVTFYNFSTALCLPLLLVIFFPFIQGLMTAVSKSYMLLVSSLPKLCFFLPGHTGKLYIPASIHRRVLANGT